MALDLTQTVPRSPFDELDGYAWLPRMIDKARAHFAGTRGEYSAYPCPGDKGFLGYFGLDAAALGEVIKGGASDEAIAAWVKQHTTKDPAGYRESLRKAPTNPFMRVVVWGFKRSVKARVGATRPNVNWDAVDSLPKVLCADEGHPLPA